VWKYDQTQQTSFAADMIILINITDITVIIS